jgi:hypothetical protein
MTDSHHQAQSLRDGGTMSEKDLAQHDSGEIVTKIEPLQGTMGRCINGNWSVYLPYTDHIKFIEDEIVEVTITRRVKK